MKLTAVIFIFHFLLSLLASGQLQKTSHFQRKGKIFLCTENIILDSTGLFFQEWGCESEARMTFGKYFIVKDGGLRVKFLSLDSIEPINHIKQIEKMNDSLIFIRLIDRENKLLSSAFRISLLDTAGKFESLWLEDEGFMRINRLRYKELFLDQLLLLYKEVTPIRIADSSMEIQFNLPKGFLLYSQARRGVGKQQKLFVKKDGLYDSTRRRRLYELSK